MAITSPGFQKPCDKLDRVSSDSAANIVGQDYHRPTAYDKIEKRRENKLDAC
jgi:hypothetical protein